MNTTTLYDNVEFSPEIASDIAEIHDLTKDIVLQAVAEFSENGTIDIERYDTKMQMGLASLVQMLTIDKVEEVLTEIDEGQNAAIISTVSFVTDKMDDHFHLDEDGVVHINRENPPDLTKSYEVLRQTVALKDIAQRMDDFGTWLLGSLVDELERFHGDEFDITDVMSQSEKSYNTVITAVKVYRDFKGSRVKGLSFTHHKEVCFVKDISQDQKIEILKLCKRRHYMSKMPRMIGNYLKEGGDFQEIKECANQDDVKQLVKEHNPSTVKYLVYNQSWEIVYGKENADIEGRIVIDTKHWTVAVEGSTPMKIQRRLS
jgi:hypothetical protein